MTGNRSVVCRSLGWLLLARSTSVLPLAGAALRASRYHGRAMFVLALEVDLHIAEARSLKDKRSVVKSLVEGAKKRYGVAAAEVGYQQQWQRVLLGFAVVAPSEGHAREVMDEVDRFVWSHPEVQVLATERRWLE